MMTAKPLFLFCKYVEAGSLSAASRNLNVSKSTLSKSLTDLEAHLQVKLVHRSTRSFKLTEVGEEIYQHARILCDELNLIDDIAKSRNAKPFGRIRISASMPIVQHCQRQFKFDPFGYEFGNLNLTPHLLNITNTWQYSCFLLVLQSIAFTTNLSHMTMMQ